MLKKHKKKYKWNITAMPQLPIDNQDPNSQAAAWREVAPPRARPNAAGEETVTPHEKLAAPVMERDRLPNQPRASWDRRSYLPAAGTEKLAKDEALARGRAIYYADVEQSKTEAEEVGRFFARYPSNAARQVVYFHSYWAQNQTFQQLPLQAYLYHQVRPVDSRGLPKNALWQAYAYAVEAGLPQGAIEESYLRAHIQDFKDVVHQAEFKQLFALADPDYRRVVEAYLDTLQRLEADLERGIDPVKVARKMFPQTMLYLTKRGVSGFMLTGPGLKAMADVRQPLTRQMWSALGDMTTNVLFGRRVREPAPSRVTIQLTASEAAVLRAQTGIPFRAARNDMTPGMLAHASVAEPDRREQPAGALRRYALRWQDFTAFQKLHPGLRPAGADGIMSAREVQGVLRDVQARIRSQLIHEFFGRYPVPEAGILVYSANMLALNGAYGESEMFGVLANAIMPVDNDGKPKNALWQAYADACERHKASGSPSMEALESLWFKAHMQDFAVVDTPDFQHLLQGFWTQAAGDPALEPMVIYTQAMVGGRQEFEKCLKGNVSQETAFYKAFGHFARTIREHRSFPFWREDLRELGKRLGKAERRQPELDERGLPTEKALFDRSVQGIRMMTGLWRLAARGLSESLGHKAERAPAAALVDLAQILSPEQLKQVDPGVRAFYLEPGRFDIHAGVDMPAASRLLFGDIGGVLAGQGQIPDRVNGYEGYPLEMEIYRDAQGHTHWDRYVVVDGERKPMFEAIFETEGRQIKETFSVRGKKVALYFDVEPYQGGLRLKLDKKKSSALLSCSDITFATRPTATGLVTIGQYQSKHDIVTGRLELRITRR